MDAGEFLKSIGKLGSRYVSEYTQNAERYAKFISGLAQQPPAGLTPGKAQERYAEFVRAEVPKVASAVAEAGLAYYTVLLNTGAETANRFFESVTQTQAAASAASQGKQPSTLLFHGKRGEWPSNAFVVSNNRNEAVELRFEVTEASTEDGSVSFRPTVRFSPESCQLAARSEQIVQCSVQLAKQFRPGETYRAQIRAVGLPELSVRIAIHLDESPIESPEPSKTKKKRKAK